MKHQSNFNEYRKLHAKDIAELRRCLELYGGEYDWNVLEHEGECRPIVTVGLDYYVGDVDVKRIYIDKNNQIRVEAAEHDGWADMEFVVDNLHFGHVDFLMDYMQEPLTDHEKLLVCRCAMDLESGNHLLHQRSDEQKEMIAELSKALDTPETERNFRQRLLAEEYRLCTDYEYAKSKIESK